MAWADKKKGYDKDYVKSRQVRAYPPPVDLKFVRSFQEQKGMGESETVSYFIRVARETLTQKNKHDY